MILLGGFTTHALEVGDQVCVQGFVMDFFCIERGRLLDKPSLRTLEFPDRHSVYCLVDVSSCLRSPFEILLDPLEGESLYARGWRLDDDTKDRVIDLVRNLGYCSTCENSAGILQGFRAAMNATVLDLGSSTMPPLISATVIVRTTGDDNNVCGTSTQPQVVIDNGDGTTTTINTTTPTITAQPPNRITNTGTSDLQKKYYAHASLMLIGWGWLLPTGTLFARFLKHRPEALWFQIHRVLQVVGLLFAIVGWIIALVNFDVFRDKGHHSYKHGILGMVTMVLGLLQPLNALLRPTHDGTTKDDAKTALRVVWEYAHKGTGYVALALAVVTIGYGTLSLPNPDDQKTFQTAYGAGVGGFLLLLFVILQYDRATYQEEHHPDKASSKETNAEEQAGMLEAPSGGPFVGIRLLQLYIPLYGNTSTINEKVHEHVLITVHKCLE